MAPSFTLKDTNGVEHTLAQYLADGKIVVLEWFNPDCPFIVKHHQLNRTMNETFMTLQHKGMVWLAINSGAPGKQGAGLERNKKAHTDYEMLFPILLDESGTVGRAYGAKTTPHMFVIGKDGKVAYSGAIDNDPSPTKPGERNYIISALRALMDGHFQGMERPFALPILTTPPETASPPAQITASAPWCRAAWRAAWPRHGSRCTTASPRSRGSGDSSRTPARGARRSA